MSLYCPLITTFRGRAGLLGKSSTYYKNLILVLREIQTIHPHLNLHTKNFGVEVNRQAF